jgi:hypothetical protein
VTYVLVSLCGDEATERNDEFARVFAASYPPVAAFHGHPDHDKVAAAIRTTPNALVFGHDGGGTLRASSQGPKWADPEEFAMVFRDARVWVYACDTRAPKLEADLESFGRRAKDDGVAVFAGHCAAITAVLQYAEFPSLRQSVHRALDRAFRAFLGGENRSKKLQRIALRSSARGRRTALEARPIVQIMESLRVLS